MPEPKFMDIEERVNQWAWQIFDVTRAKDESKLQKDHLRFEISWKKVRFQHGEPVYTDEIRPEQPKGQVVFTTTFVNDSAGEHEYSFKTERTTKSTCEVEMFRGVTTGVHMDLTLKTPCEIFEANAGFSRDVEVSKSEGETIERELVWSVDSTINLPPQTKTQASLVVNQQEYGSKFKITSRFWGLVIVSIFNRKDNNNFVKTIEGQVSEIFRNIPGVNVKGSIVTYESEGKCQFRYGIDQQVLLKQMSITEADKNLPIGGK